MKKSLNITITAALAAGVVLAGCGKSNTDNQSAASNQPANGATSQAPANSATQGKAAASGPAVDYHKLQSYLPDISGYQKGTPEGASLQMGNSTYTEAGASYANGDARIKITIFDYAGMTDMLDPYKMKFSFENDEGYTKSMDWNGFSGWETWEKKNNTANAAAIVGNRIVVVAEGDGQGDASTVHATMSKIDMKGIAALCGAQ
jgi:hypothetical protein